MSQLPELDEHLRARPWLERFLSPCLTGLSWGEERIDRLTGFGRFGRAQRSAVLDEGPLKAAQVDELIELLDRVDRATGSGKLEAIERVVRRAVELTTASKRLSESEQMRPRRRSTRQELEASEVTHRRVVDDILTEPITVLDGLGPRRAERFHARGIGTLEELLNWLPAGYEDRTQEAPLDALQEGETVAVRVQLGRGRVEGTRGYGRARYVVRCVNGDGDSMYAVFFQPNPQMWERNLGSKEGRWVRLFGKVGRWQKRPAMIHPKIEYIDLRQELTGGGLHPIYPEIPGIKGPQLQRILGQALEWVRQGVIDPIPQSVRRQTGLPALWESWRILHQPNAGDTPEQRRLAADRFAYQELFLTQMGLLIRRQAQRNVKGLEALKGQPLGEFAAELLPFKLTGGQQRSLREIDADLRRGAPMNRLLQGDVGSGKTAVAAVAAYGLARSGFQSALMAPTELLARQHAASIDVLLQGRLRIGLLTGSVSARVRRHLLAAVAAGEVDVLVGTHALVAKPLDWKALALVMIDEQHRFGVEQRLTLREAARQSTGFDPHTLAMTATPIPRTLSMTVWGDLEVSVIKELPPGRQPVHTRAFRLDRLAEPFELAEQELQRGRQIFVVLPLVRESEKVDLADAERVYEQLRQSPLARFGVALLHGQMPHEDKQAIMESFREGSVRVLVSTTVVEVGVDVPEASIMMIWHAERFGLSQLHQLRGRVGRGAHASRCFLLHDPNCGQTARHRLRVLENSSDGFELAMEDLRLRGPGEMAGVRQSGADRYHHADLVGDSEMVVTARQHAEALIQGDPDLTKDEHRPLAAVLRGRFAHRLALLGVA
ncbi:MAG: ATP-dependent DNA helicase RecG [Myxococcota bacterium]|nr:ATP-dependent DNA helicase RecG [Myxococcota bacterium]